MNKKKALICLSIIAILTICVPNVAATPTSKQTSEVYSSYTMDVPVKERPILVILLSNNDTYVNKPVDLYGLLGAGDPHSPHWIENATINVQRLNYDGTSWSTIGSLTTQTGKYAGFFAGTITPRYEGPYIYRATYDGDSHYAPTISNVEALRVYSR